MIRCRNSCGIALNILDGISWPRPTQAFSPVFLSVIIIKLNWTDCKELQLFCCQSQLPPKRSDFLVGFSCSLSSKPWWAQSRNWAAFLLALIFRPSETEIKPNCRRFSLSIIFPSQPQTNPTLCSGTDELSASCLNLAPHTLQNLAPCYSLPLLQNIVTPNPLKHSSEYQSEAGCQSSIKIRWNYTTR